MFPLDYIVFECKSSLILALRAPCEAANGIHVLACTSLLLCMWSKRTHWRCFEIEFYCCSPDLLPMLCCVKWRTKTNKRPCTEKKTTLFFWSKIIESARYNARKYGLLWKYDGGVAIDSTAVLTAMQTVSAKRTSGHLTLSLSPSIFKFLAPFEFVRRSFSTLTSDMWWLIESLK